MGEGPPRRSEIDSFRVSTRHSRKQKRGACPRAGGERNPGTTAFVERGLGVDEASFPRMRESRNDGLKFEGFQTFHLREG